MTDVCNCEYTSHGHCGKVVGNDVDNDATLEWLAAAAVSHARAGADIVAPSDMMDGRVAAIRQASNTRRSPGRRRSGQTIHEAQGVGSAGKTNKPPASAVSAHLEKLMESAVFRGSPRLASLLQHTVSRLNRARTAI
jgi:hypothetical protein